MPQEHFLRKLEAALDLSFVYEETSPLYSRKYGRPPIDPVVLVKYLLVGFLYGIPSEAADRAARPDGCGAALVSGAGICLTGVPDHSTISQLRRRKPSFRKVFRRLFEEVVRQCVAAGLVSGRLAVTDSTPCEGQRLPGVGRAGGNAGRGGRVIGSGWMPMRRKGWRSWSAGPGNAAKSGQSRSSGITAGARSGSAVPTRSRDT